MSLIDLAPPPVYSSDGTQYTIKEEGDLYMVVVSVKNKRGRLPYMPYVTQELPQTSDYKELLVKFIKWAEENGLEKVG